MGDWRFSKGDRGLYTKRGAAWDVIPAEIKALIPAGECAIDYGIKVEPADLIAYHDRYALEAIGYPRDKMVILAPRSEFDVYGRFQQIAIGDPLERLFR